MQTIHPQYRDKPRAFFERKAKELTLSQNEMREVTATDKNLLKILYTVAEKNRQSKERAYNCRNFDFAMRNRDCQGII